MQEEIQEADRGQIRRLGLAGDERFAAPEVNRHYSGPGLEQQGHIALYIGQHQLIQALPYWDAGVTVDYTDQETYSWDFPQFHFTVYGFLPGVHY